MLVEVWSVKTIMMRFQAEMRSMLLETGGRAILAMNWQRPWLNYFVFQYVVEGNTSQ